MREVPLVSAGGYVALVDDEDYALVAGYSWRADFSDQGIVYARRGWRVEGREQFQYMHTLITGVRGIDHRDRNGLNNQRDNLREATKSQNAANQVARTGRFKGVSRKHKKWRAKIQDRVLGYFQSEEAAARAYDLAALETWGEFARLNFPELGR